MFSQRFISRNRLLKRVITAGRCASSRARRIMLAAALLPVLGMGILGAIVAVQAHINQELYANQAAETLRTIIGRRNVGRIEYVAFTLAQKIHKLTHVSHGQINPTVAQRLSLPLTVELRPGDDGDRPPRIEPLIASPAMVGEGNWRPMDTSRPGLWTTQIRSNPEEQYECVNLVAIDLHRLQLTFVPGTEVTGNPQMSRIPSQKDPSAPAVWAVFNGGFRNHDGDTGQRKAGVQYRPLQEGKGSIVLTGNGVEICKWDMLENLEYPAADVRQNLPILLNNGLFDERILHMLKKKRLDFPTYRTGLGLTADHRWLIYAGGAYQEPIELATALRLASCREAIHLDQNRGNVFFDLIKPGKSGLEFTGVDPSLHLIMHKKVLTGSVRDFFYLTQRSTAPRQEALGLVPVRS